MTLKKAPRRRAPIAHKGITAELTNKPILNRPPKENDAQNILAEEMIEWAQKENSLLLEDFPLSKVLSPYRFFKCAQNNEYFAEALEIAKGLIASRLKHLALEGKIDSGFVSRILPVYDTEYRELVMAKILKHQESRPQTITVVMEEFSSKNLLPS